MGVCYATADELFRAGLDSVGELVKMETSKQVQYALLNINNKKTPLCPEKYKVHIGQGFTDSLITFIEWLKYRPSIGGEASTWILEF